MKNKKAISPVIATVILVAVAVAIAIAVAFWAAGLAGTFTRFEKLDFTSAYSSGYSASPPTWNITCAVTNTGSSDATIVDVYVNGKPLTAYSNFYVYNSTGGVVYGGTVTALVPISVPTGSSTSLKVTVVNGTTGLFTSGQTIDIKLHSSSGTDYPKSVVLP